MGVWKKSKRADPAEVARIQAVIDRWTPELQRAASEASRRSGRSTGWDQIGPQIKVRLAQEGIHIPDGYDVNMNGELVYTNKTPFLQQAAWASTPFVGGYGAEKIAGAFGAGSGSAAGGVGGGAMYGPPASLATPAAATSAVPAGYGLTGIGGGTGVAVPPLAARHLPVGDFMGGPENIASEGISRAYSGEDFLGARPAARPAGAGSDAAERAMNPIVEAAYRALAGLPGLLANRGPSDEEKAQLEQLRKLQAMQQQRIEYQNPLFQAVSQLAMSRLPGSVQSPMGEMK